MVKRYSYVLDTVKEPKFLIVDINNSIKDINKLPAEVIVGKTYCSIDKAPKKGINYQGINIKNKSVIINSTDSEKNLKNEKVPYTVVAICNSLTGKRLYLVCYDRAGQLKIFSYDSLVAKLKVKKVKIFTNMYFSNGGFVPYQSSLDIPNVTVGTGLSTKTIDVENIKEDTKPQTDNLIKMLNEIKTKMNSTPAPILAMYKSGFGKYVKAFNLTTAYPETTLWYYYELMKNGEFVVVSQMLGQLMQKSNFDNLQLKELAQGLRDGINVKAYANSGIDHQEMRLIRTKLMKNIKLTPIPKVLKEFQEQARKKGLSEEKIVKTIRAFNNKIKK